MKKYYLLLFCLSCIITCHAQPILDNYIREGLANNESIKQQTFLLKKNLYALKEARSLFFPTLSVSGSYSKADGGRTVDFPAGDILNPIYHTLNELTNSHRFPTIDNMEIQMNPDNYYDAKIRLAMPLFNAELLYNRKIKRATVDAQEMEVLLYKRELVKDIKTAYYLYCQAHGMVGIRRNAVRVAEENLRINQSLLKNGKTNPTTVLRSENEVTKAENDLFSASQTLKNSQAYFNFLLNRPLDAAVDVEIPAMLPDSESHGSGIDNREEVKKLLSVAEIKRLHTGLAQSFLLPKVSTYLDLGSQGFDWKVNSKTRYYMFGVSLQWNFSLGGQNLHRTKAARADFDAAQSQTEQVRNQLNLQIRQATNNYEEALNNYFSAESQVSVAERYFNDMSKQYKEGQALYIELLDAQTQYVNTQELLNIARYNVFIKHTEVERANAGFNLNNN